MATILLQSAGAFLGSFFGPVGSAIGSAAGAMAGYMIDNQIIQSFQHFEGARLSGMRPLEAEEGGTIPFLYGSARLPGTLIWATRFEERKTQSHQGFKGGPKVTEYDYFANVAFALCEGEISFVRRVWADGREIDLRRVEMRVHTGTPDQLPDPLIVAKQGDGNAPAYRGVAYVVFERLALEDFGNRIPQFQFEVVRACGGPGEAIRVVTLIPGATEFGLHPDQVRRKVKKGKYESLNRHVLHADSDVLASLDELQALCPGLRHVSVVVPWFGDDLRAAHCTIRPGVTQSALPGVSREWTVAGHSRAQARLMSQVDGAAAYGGTPDDASLKALIQELNRRGLKVTLYPFVMMDIPAGNGLPDPWGAAEQAAYPWRGRITATRAPGFDGTPDRTASIHGELAAFLGNTAAATAHDIPALPDWAATANEWGYRRLVLHYANLAAEAGGIDAFLIGSELRGLTALRDEEDAFPFVSALRHLAREVRAIVGPDTKLTYGADWSEYFGLQPADGSADVFYNLDPLWADDAIDAVGIENYMPLADWRDTDWKSGNPDGATSPWDKLAMQAAIAGGEGFDWFYASDGDRRGRIRSPISDGAHGKPWVYRYKDLRSWWENTHVERRGGMETGMPSAWVPASKPIWFTEIGCPAIDKGANQPNVFHDPKSSESAVPYFSRASRDDLVQRRFIRAHLDHWSDEAANPLSGLTGKPMVDTDRLYWWAWDARPYPAFPLDRQAWRDGGNWLLGHWMNGRLEAPSLGAVFSDILDGQGLSLPEVSGVNAMAEGVLIDRPASARDVLEQLCTLFGIEAHEEAGRLHFRSIRCATVPEPVNDRVLEREGASLQIRLGDAETLPLGAVVAFRDPMLNYQTATAADDGSSVSQSRLDRLGHPGTLDAGKARALARDHIADRRAGRKTVSFSMPAGHGRLPGQRVSFPDEGLVGEVFRITSIDEGVSARIEVERLCLEPPAAGSTSLPSQQLPGIWVTGAPDVIFMDLPASPWTSEPESGLRVAAWAKPWVDQIVETSPDTTGFSVRARIDAPGTMGVLATPLPVGLGGLIERGAMFDVVIEDGELSSVSEIRLLNWANGAAVLSSSGAWEILQFLTADELSPGLWRVSGLLRGQFGTVDAMQAGASAGAPFVLLNDRVVAAGLRSSEIGLTLNWRVRPAIADAQADDMENVQLAGGLRASAPLAPVHMRCDRAPGGDIVFSWIRCTRINGDSWDGIDVPLGEESEAYVAEIRDVQTGIRLHSADVTRPALEWNAAQVQQAVSAGTTHCRLLVRQQGRSGPGLPATLDFAIT